MDVENMEAELYRLVQDFKLKPALVIAKLYLVSKTNENYVHRLNELLIQRLELLSETDGSVDVTFEDVYNLADSINMNENNQIRISYILHAIRTDAKLPSSDIELMLNSTNNDVPKTLICRAFCALSMEDTWETYKSILQAFNQSNRLETRSILFSFDLDQLYALKDELIDGKKRDILHCACATGCENMGFNRSTQHLASQQYITSSVSNSTAETSFTYIYQSMSTCELHRVISELDDVIEKLKSRAYDATPIYLAHKNARRYNHAESFLLRYKSCIEKVKYNRDRMKNR